MLDPTVDAGLEIPDNATIVTLKKLIIGHEDYDEEFTKIRLETVITESLQKAEREFQLEKLKIASNGSGNVSSSSATGSNKNFELSKIIKRLDMNEPNADIGIYLDLQDPNPAGTVCYVLIGSSSIADSPNNNTRTGRL